MKTFYLTLILAFSVGSMCLAQNWSDNLPKDKLDNGTLTLNDYQKAFDDYWAPYDVKGGYYMTADGEKTKAPGWKLFKRWVWKMEQVCDAEGNFPTTSTPEELEKYFKEYPESTKSTNGDWRNIGYDATNGGYQGIGRINTIAFHPSDANTFWVGTPSGGLWKTADGGTSWTVLTDNNAVLGVSAIAVNSDYATSSTIYIATGDRDGGSSWTMGGGNLNDNNSIGVLKSSDGGATWNTTGLTYAQSAKKLIYDLLIDPTNNNRLIAATDDGIYETTDGGANWSNFTSDKCWDLEFQPGNSNVVYAAYKPSAWITKWTKSGTWSYFDYQLTTTSVERTEIAVSANNSAVVYALTVNSGEGLEAIYKSTDSGSSYSKSLDGSISGNNLLGYECDGTTFTGQGAYDVFITANPANANELYVGGINIWKSTNGGTSWSIKSVWSGDCGGTVETVHADQHCCEFQNSSTVFFGHDGGIYKSTDGASTYSDLTNGLTINQIYRLGVSQSSNNEVITGLQDNGTHLYSGGNWVANAVIGGDGMECLINPSDDNNQFGEYTEGDISRTTNHWGAQTNVRDLIRTASGVSTLEGAWVTPFMLDPNNSNNLFVGYEELWKSTDQGATSGNFSVISSFTGTNTIRSLQIAPSNSNYIYVGFQTKLYKSTVGGGIGNWTDITGTLPVGNGNITYICVKNDDENTVWVTLGGYNSDAVWVTTNGGTTWTNNSTGLPQIPAMSIVQNVLNTTDELYVSTTGGVWMKHGTSNWVSFNTDLPAVFCAELDIYYDNTTPSNSRLRVGTFGRGLWESDLRGPPVAEFSADNLLPASSMAWVNFSDESIGAASWSWSFSPATVTYQGGTNSTSQNPSVTFTNPGAYDVTLQATNGLGSDSEIKTAYIHQGQPGLWKGTTDSDWSKTSNWENELVPGATTQVSITGVAIPWPTFTGDFEVGTDCGLLSMAPGTEFTVTGDFAIASGKTATCVGATTLFVGGDWTNNGTFTPGNGTVEFYGTNASGINITPLPTVYLINDDITTWPGNWSGDIGVALGQFYQSTTTSNAGGSSPEIIFSYLNSYSTNTRRLYQSAGVGYSIGLTSLTLKFNHYIDHYDDGTDDYTIKVQYSTDGLSWFDTGWSLVNPTSDVGPETVTTTLTRASHDVGTTSTYYIAFMVTGNLYDIDYWYIDDVQLYYNPVGTETFNNLAINKTDAEVSATGNLYVNNLNIKPEAFFTNALGNTLTVVTELLLEANANGTASFIDEGTTTVINGTKSQYYCETNQWHYMSACFDPQGNTFNLLFPGSDPVPTAFYRWDESHSQTKSIGWWIDILNSGEWGANTFVAGQGYAISDYSKGTTYILSGDLNNTSINPQILSPAMTKTTGSSAEGYNLVGNPYPCSMAANTNADASYNFLSNNSAVLDATKSGLYFYDEAYGDYRTVTNVTAAAYISRGQGFMVKTKGLPTPNNKVSFNAADRKHGAAPFYKGGDETQRFFLTVTNPENVINETEIAFMDGMTYGLDISYDAGKFKGNPDLSLYTYLVENINEEFAIQALPPLTEPVIVPVGLNAQKLGNYTLTAEMLNFEPGTPVTLEDKYTSVQTDLSVKPSYSFVVETPGTFNDRFLLHFKSAVGIEENSIMVAEEFEIYTIGNQVFILPSNEIENFSVSVFNSIGQLMVQKEFKGNSSEQINVAPPGTYIVRVVSERGVTTKKVVVR